MYIQFHHHQSKYHPAPVILFSRIYPSPFKKKKINKYLLHSIRMNLGKIFLFYNLAQHRLVGPRSLIIFFSPVLKMILVFCRVLKV